MPQAPDGVLHARTLLMRVCAVVLSLVVWVQSEARSAGLRNPPSRPHSATLDQTSDQATQAPHHPTSPASRRKHLAALRPLRAPLLMCRAPVVHAGLARLHSQQVRALLHAPDEGLEGLPVVGLEHGV